MGTPEQVAAIDAIRAQVRRSQLESAERHNESRRATLAPEQYRGWVRVTATARTIA